MLFEILDKLADDTCIDIRNNVTGELLFSGMVDEYESDGFCFEYNSCEVKSARIQNNILVVEILK
jgi:hypothetical protein